MNRRVLLLAVASAPLLNGCLYDRWFDLEWDEEVQLHDGRVIVVHLRHTYERIQQGFTRYGGTIMSRDTTLTFDAGGASGKVTQLFKGFDPLFIGQDRGAWYAVIYGNYYYKSQEIPGQDWGELEGPYDQWAVKLAGKNFVPISMLELPASFQEPNMLLLYGRAEEHAQFAGKTVTLTDKAAWKTLHPPGYADVRITRPKSSKRFSANTVPKLSQENSK
jgi:hypothetical protein